MTTITIKENVALKQTVFADLEELRSVLNFLSLKHNEISSKDISSEIEKKWQETKNEKLSDFNSISSDENL